MTICSNFCDKSFSSHLLKSYTSPFRHVIASCLHGGRDWFNMVPMSQALNRNVGANRGWFTLEQDLARHVISRGNVEINVFLHYDTCQLNGKTTYVSLRPTAVRMLYRQQTGGVWGQWVSRYFSQ